MRECVVVEGVRTPTGKSGWKGMAKGGQFANISAQDLLASAVEGLVEKVKQKCEKFKEEEIEDVAVACLSQIGEQGGNLGRIVALAAGLGKSVPGWTIDRQAPGGLQAINAQAQAIISGCGDIMIAAGVEHMSHYPMGSTVPGVEGAIFPMIVSERSQRSSAMSMPMGHAAEMVAEKYNLKREELDKFGLRSHQKAVKTMRDLKSYKKRVVPVTVLKGDKKEIIGEVDETPRPGALDNPEEAYEKMKTLKPSFNVEGMVTAGNSSGIADGAAAVMLMSGEKAKELGIKPLARIVSMAVAASDPHIMLLGPIPAMNKAFNRAGLQMKDIDVFEPNEAFASPVLAFCKEYGIAFDDERINPTGGAIALGHPIGASGVIYFLEMVHYLAENNLKYGIQTLSGGSGVGIATIVSRE
ncbi:MAG: 3-ketoacyl-CoA thiolase [Syntrophomonadaceae bacterium]|nr:3-ketoacyl-CoA thiolase [Bacillota bacterium]